MAYAIVVEDGTGLSTANSYMTAATADAYLEQAWKMMGISSAPSGLSDIDCTSGSFYLDSQFVNRWKGMVIDEDQALAFPRYGITDYDGNVIDSDAVPTKIVQAASVMAYYASTEGSSLMPNEASPGDIKRIKQKVAVVEKEIEYQGGRSSEKWYRHAQNLIKDFILTGSPVTRA